MKPELVEKFHVSYIGLFGFVVRDDYSERSDNDIIVDFSEVVGIDFIDLADYIETKLDKSVHLVSKKGIKPKYF